MPESSAAELPPLVESSAIRAAFARRRRRALRSYCVSALLFVLTLFTTLVVGAQLQLNFLDHQPMFALDLGLFPLGWIAQQPARLLLGIPFSFTLMTILLAHELGHFFASRHYGVDVSPPYFIPAPTVIGTMGAFIRLRSPLPSSAALFDMGIAGPIAGFVLAVPALAVGLGLSRFAPEMARGAELQLGYPLIFYLLAPLAPHRGGAPAPADLLLHPVALAAWVGFLATALNLIPGGQLDGGHILYALWPRAHRALARPLAAALLLIGPFFWLGWLIWGVALLFLGKHPPVPAQQPLGRMRQALAAFALAMLVLSLISAPFFGAGLDVGDFTAFWHAIARRL